MKKRIIFLPLLILFAAAGLLLVSHPAHAASNNNNLIDDGVFDNVGTMTAAQIDNWLNSNFPNSCISTKNGFSAPDPTGYSPNPSQFFYSSSPVSAGTVVYDAAQAYGINPQVLLTKLQNEEMLVDGAIPQGSSQGCNTWQYASAVGYGCTDSGTNTHNYSYPGGNLVTPLYYINGNPVNSITGSCVNSGPKAGFSEQIIHAAWLLAFSRHKSEGDTGWAVVKGNWNNCDDNNTCPASYNIPASSACYSGYMTQGTFERCPTDTNGIYYDGYATIDGNSVHMDNGATAALYVYTPHIQSFNTIFTNYFGTTYDIYSWQWAGQAVYTDSSKTTPIDFYHQPLQPNTRYYFTLAALNTGDITWKQGEMKLGTSHPTDRMSPIYDSSWLNSSRAATMLESTVAPGQTAHFEFWVHIPNTLFSSSEYFNLVDEGVTWLNDPGVNWPIKAPTFSWQWMGQAVYTDNTKSDSVDFYHQALSPNHRYYFTVAAKNTGTGVWTQGQLKLGTSHSIDRTSAIYDSSWLSQGRPATMLESSVAPGQIAHFEFWAKMPSYGINSKEYFNLVDEGIAWLNDPGLSWPLNPVSYSWQWQGQNVFTDSTKTTSVDSYSQPLAANTRYYFIVNALNTSNVTWFPDQVRLGTSHPTDRTSQIYDSSWLSVSRPASFLESSVKPGQTAHFEFWITTPASGANAKEYFNLVSEGVSWMNDPGLNWVVNTQ